MLLPKNLIRHPTLKTVDGSGFVIQLAKHPTMLSHHENPSVTAHIDWSHPEPMNKKSST